MVGCKRIAVVRGLMRVDIKAASRFDAIGAARTILTPVNPAKLAYPVKSSGSQNRMNMVTIGHFQSL
jgi:hypothetical protein